VAAISVYCMNCDREVYIGPNDTAACPVCSTPLVRTVETGQTEPQEDEKAPG
jgi:DNA-directed RNA polymerase subunit RPC12/RpoP